MFTAIVFMVISLIYTPIYLIGSACKGDFDKSNVGKRQEEVKRHNRQVRYEDKTDNDYGFIVRRDK